MTSKVPPTENTEQLIINTVQVWLSDIVIKLNLCPFAKRELVKERVRFTVLDAKTTEELLIQLQAELELIYSDNSIETSLLIHPYVLRDFDDYNQFLNYSDNLLEHLQFEGVLQIASFHPDYQFGGTQVDDAENYTNRSPYPILHILREDSLDAAIANYPDVDDIPANNIQLMNEIGRKKMADMLAKCHKKDN